MVLPIATHRPGAASLLPPAQTPVATNPSHGHQPVAAAIGSALVGNQISAVTAPQTNASTSKSFSLGSFVKDSAVVQKGAQMIHATARHFGHNGIASVAASLKTGVLERARLEQATLRADLSATDPAQPGILGTSVQVKGGGSLSVSDFMEDLRVGKLGGDKRISKSEMMTYVAMGERICDAVANSSDGQPPLQTTVNGKSITIPSNIDTARAISWYMQAKALVDNADPSRDPASVGSSGSMLIRDPGNKLYNFLSAAPSAYGRTSTHLKAHSENAGVKMSFGEAFEKTGIISASPVRSGGAIQRGIEDYGSKMPGGGGTMLFDRIKPDSSGDPILFMKLESVGTPTSFSFFGRHVDPADGFARSVKGLASVAGRNLSHGVHLVESIAAKHFKSEENYRGEKLDKGPSKAIYKEFSAALRNADWLSDADKEAIAHTVKTNGATGLLDAVGAIEHRAAMDGLDAATVKPFQDARDDLVDLVKGMGADLGLDRRGNEVHVTY
jgi:hypothetical protein